MKAIYTEADYENAIINLFQEMEYDYVYAPDLVRDFHSPLYKDVLIDSLWRINPKLPDDAIQEALRKIEYFDSGSLVQKNNVFMDYIQNGISVSYFENGEEKSAICYVVDFNNINNNSFI